MPDLPTRVMDAVRDVFEARWWRRLLVVLLIIVAVTVPRVSGLDAGATTAFLVLTALLYLEALETVVLHVDDRLDHPTVIPSHGEATDRVEERLAEVNPDRIHLLDYSTRFADTVLEKAADHGVDDIYLLLKIPQSAVNRSQYDGQILPAIRTNLRSFVQDNPDVDLHVRLYGQDGAVRGRRIGGSHLLLGWYTRDFQADEHGALPGSETVFEWVREGTVRGQQSLHGHNNPMIEVSRDDPGFEAVDEEFFKVLYRNLWETGLSPRELYDRERERHDADAPSGPYRSQTPLVEWVADGGSVDERKVEYLDAISGAKTDTGEIFT